VKKQTNKKVLVIVTAILVSALAAGLILANYPSVLTESGSANVSFTLGSVHSRIRIVNGKGETVLDEYHAGAVTKLGLNLTMNKLFGNTTAYNSTEYTYDLDYVGIGDQGTLTVDSVVLPGEWNRTIADTQHDLTYNHGNWTLVIHPGAGPYTADCLGVYYHATNNALFLYDTFGEVSGIDDTFTITLEIMLSAS
jgi:hypothetical protein